MNNERHNWIIRKMREPSTWAGLSVIAAAFGVPPGTFELVTQIGIALGGIIAVVASEKGPE